MKASSIHRSLCVLGLAAGVAALGACSDITGNGGDATIVVENNASVPVFRMFIADCDDDAWGDDELGLNETIGSGEDRSFGVDDGCHDLRAEFSDDTYAEEYGVDLDQGDEFTWELFD